MFSKKSTYLLIIIALIVSLTFSFTLGGIAYADDSLNYVYLGGVPIGVVAKLEGVLIIDIIDVTTRHGGVSPADKAGMKKGDIILSINDKEIKSAESVSDVVEDSEGRFLKIKVMRDDNILELIARGEVDVIANKYKLGVLVKNEVSGVGTLTYIRADNKRFGGLGHKILDPASSSKNVYNEGHIYDCNIIGSVKGKAGEAGELRGLFSRSASSIGVIDKNQFCGIYGLSYQNDFNGYPKIGIGNHNDVKIGKAKIYTTIKGSKPDMYDIEIVKTVKQASPAEKSIVIHVTDERLINTTGGIVQGMSGSPIIQNDKLIGAVTHVFVNDPTRGFGIYIDWMIDN